MKQYFLTIGILLLAFISFGQKQFELIDRRYNVYDSTFHSCVEFFKDSTNSMSLNEASVSSFESIRYYHSKNFDPKSTYWFRVPLRNLSEDHKLWFFEITDPHLQEIGVYQVGPSDTIAFQKTGFNRNFSSRFSDHKNFLFPIKFYKDSSLYVYFTINNYYPSLSFGLRPAEQFMDYALNEYYFLGIFYGILLIMALYNLFIFLSTRELVYLYYVAYVLCYCLNAFREDGIGFQFIWGNKPWFNFTIHAVAPVLLVVSFVFYSQKFLRIKSFSRELNSWIIFSLIGYCVLYLINEFYFELSWISYTYLIPFGLIYYAGVVAWKKGDNSSLYFLLAFSFFILCFSIFILRLTGIVPPQIFTVYALNFGFLIEVVLFSYALGQRLKFEKEQKARVDGVLIAQLRENEKLKDSLTRELEVKVDERTRELSVALQEVQLKNKKIEELNSLLESDNKNLNEDIKDITRARLMLKDLTLDEFQKIYPDEDSCYKYLADIKWGKSYSCKKCSNENSSNGKASYSRRCTKCGYDESVTSFTLFHNSKLPITKSFYLVYLILAHKNMSSHELSEKLGLRQKTCWAFKKKVMEAMGTTKTPKLTSREWGKIFYN